MKKIYLYAVALSFAFTSCSSDAWVENDLTHTAVYKTAQPSSLIDLITTIESDCIGITYEDVQSRISAVERIAFQNRDFQKLAQKGYCIPKVSDWTYLSTTEKTDVIEELNYSETVKSYLYAMLIDQQEFADSFFMNTSLSVSEQQLLETCRLLNDNGDDDPWKDTRPITFAYGYQTSEANGVLMALISSQQ